MKKLRKFFVPALCALVYFTLFVRADGCDYSGDGDNPSCSGVPNPVKVYSTITIVNSSSTATHLYIDLKGASAKPGNKVEPGRSRTEVCKNVITLPLDDKCSIDITLVAARNGETISTKTVTFTDYEKSKDGKGYTVFNGNFTIIFPW